MAEDVRVLLAEDDAVTRRMLESQLMNWGYDVISCPDGDSAWEVIEQGSPPRVMVIDWNMPGLDGIELCRKLPESFDDYFVYVIVVTGRNSIEDAVHALDSGAHDFVSKPYNPSLLRCRISVGFRIVHYQMALSVVRNTWERYATEMEGLAQERAKDLIAADRMSTIGAMSKGLAHEISAPAVSVLSNSQAIEQFWDSLKGYINPDNLAPGDELDRLHYMLSEFPRALEGIKDGSQTLLKFVREFNSYSGASQSTKSRCDVNASIERALALTHHAVRESITLERSLGNGLPQPFIESARFEQVMLNLVLNAINAVEQQPEGHVRIGTRAYGETVIIEVEDSGPGIALENVDRIWSAHFNSKCSPSNNAISLHVCKEIIEAQGGQITVADSDSGGARFTVILPCT